MGKTENALKSFADKENFIVCKMFFPYRFLLQKHQWPPQPQQWRVFRVPLDCDTGAPTFAQPDLTGCAPTRIPTELRRGRSLSQPAAR